MRIAQVSPLYESVPPRCYGGTERVVYHLTEELIRQGHELTLFASGDSLSQARLVAGCPRSLRLNKNCVDQLAHHIVLLEKVFEDPARFDIIHFHTDYVHFPLARRHNVPHLTTLHGRLDVPDLVPLYREFAEMPLVSISKAQRRPLPWANWQGTVYHGLPVDLYHLHEKPGEYLAFLGRICPEKRVDRAIKIAEHSGLKLKIAAKIDASDHDYFMSVVRPLLRNPRIEFLGEIGEREKEEFLGNACALLFPIDWPEPFGLAMIEALACGTPVIAFKGGSVSEIMADGVNGFIAETLEDAIEVTARVSELSRRRCREVFEERFTVGRMADEYLRIYQRLVEAREVKYEIESVAAL